MNSTADLLDASAVLAFLGNERGADRLRKIIPHGLISAVNFAEVLKKLMGRGMPKDVAFEALEAINLMVLPFGLMEAFHSTDFIHPGISLADRACLGTAQTAGYRVITGESRWTEIRRDVEVCVFRERNQ